MKTRLFRDFFLKTINEDITCDSAGIGSTNPTQFSGDTYAPGDTRVPKPLMVKVAKRKKKLKIPIQRRNPVGM